jgi:putative flippase GtrA
MSRLDTPFARYCLIGAAGIVIDAAVLAMLVSYLSIDPYSARIVSILVALTATWACHRTITFGTRDPHLLAEWFRFVLVNGIGGTVNYLVYSAMIYAMPGVSVYAALATGSAVALIVNFLGARHFAFRDRLRNAPAGTP